jgi:uncharacterized protein YbjT (DUF2867 family)
MQLVAERIKEDLMILVVGATGVLGNEICRLLTEKGERVRGLVRESSSAESKKSLDQMGVERVVGDLKDRGSLKAACRGIETIISTATCITHTQPGDSLIRTDRDGHLDLIDEARESGVRRFVFVSFPEIRYDFPMQAAKRGVEDALKKSGLTYIILRPTFFNEVWLGPHLGFDYAQNKARIYGSGENKIDWISFRDVARFAVEVLNSQEAENTTIELGGADSLTPLEAVKIFEEVCGKKFELEFVPEEALLAQYQAATDPLQKTFTGLMLWYCKGTSVDMQEALRLAPMKLHSVRDYARAVCNP